MSVAQEYLEEMAAERQAEIDAIEAERLAEEKEREDGRRKEYDLIVAKMPVELAEYYSFDPKHGSCPLKISIPKHACIRVGYWGDALLYAVGTDSATWGRFSDFLADAKQRYREPKPVVPPQPVAPKPEEPDYIEQAEISLNAFNYQRVIALALVAIAKQLREIDRSISNLS